MAACSPPTSARRSTCRRSTIPRSTASPCAMSISRRPRRRARASSTGNEIVLPGAPLPPARLYDANRYLLERLLERLGALVTDLCILRDDPAELAAVLAAAAARLDLILTSSGVSNCEADYVRAA